MPRVRLKPMFDEIHGTMYDVVLKKTRKGNTIVTNKPNMSNVTWSPAQKAHRKFWRECVAYAKRAVRDPELRSFYLEMAKKSKKSKKDKKGKKK